MPDVLHSRFVRAAIIAALLPASAVLAKALVPSQPPHPPAHLNTEQVQQALQDSEKNLFTLKVSNSTLKLNESADVELVRKAGGGATQPAHIDREIRATLTGFGFDVATVGASQQKPKPNKETIWQWTIRATDKGSHPLKVAVVAIATVDGKTTETNVKTLEATVNVEVPMADRVAGFLGGNWQWLWAAILVPIAGWLIKQRRAKRGSAA